MVRTFLKLHTRPRLVYALMHYCAEVTESSTNKQHHLSSCRNKNEHLDNLGPQELRVSVPEGHRSARAIVNLVY
jgi:hypothetical protein